MQDILKINIYFDHSIHIYFSFSFFFSFLFKDVAKYMVLLCDSGQVIIKYTYFDYLHDNNHKHTTIQKFLFFRKERKNDPRYKKTTYGIKVNRVTNRHFVNLKFMYTFYECNLLLDEYFQHVM